MNHLSFQGYTGIINTPNAELTREGSLDVLYTNHIEPWRRQRVSHADNYFMSFGLFSILEVGGRYTEEIIKDSGTYTSGGMIRRNRGGLRDLSANAKLRIPFPPEYDYFGLALGVQDLGGGASHFRSQYIVASKDIWRTRLSVGYGTGPDRLDGFFGGLEFELFPWLYLLGDYDAEETNVGIHLTTPDDFLGLPFHLGLDAKTSLENTDNIDIGLSINIPLGFAREPTKPMKKPLVRSINQAAWRQASQPAETPDGGTCDARCRETLGGESISDDEPACSPNDRERQRKTEEQIQGLVGKLVAVGFENVTAGIMGQETLYLEYENNRFNHNELDGLGMVLGAIVTQAPTSIASFIVIMKVENTPMFEIQSSMQDYRIFLMDPEKYENYLSYFLGQLRLSTNVPSYRNHDLKILADNRNSTAFKGKLLVYPGLNYFLASDVSAFDCVLSIKPDAYFSLWKGATLNARWDIPIFWTENFNQNEPLDRYRRSAEMDQLMFYQTYKHHPFVTMMMAAGQYAPNNHGVLSEIIWQPGSGRHRFKINAGFIRDDDLEFNREIFLGSYRYYLEKIDTFIELTYGKYYWNDRGLTVSLKRFFGDTALELFYKDIGEEQKAGVRFSIPLTPRRDMRPGLFQIRGDQAWSEDLSITVVDEGEQGPIKPNMAVTPELKHDLSRTYYNNDRLNPLYVKRHIYRLREAFMKWGGSITPNYDSNSGETAE